MEGVRCLLFSLAVFEEGRGLRVLNIKAEMQDPYDGK
jgi:hypothetical protein